MNPPPPRISIVIPTLNEVENVDAITARVLEETQEFDVEIIIVDDNSKDGTQKKVMELGETRPVKLLEREHPTHGLAGAVLAGARAATSDVVVVMDADLSHPPERLPDLVAPVLAGDLDMVIGSRYAPGGSTPGWPRVRRAMSRAASTLAWPLTDVNDALSGFFAVRRELLASIPSDAAGFKIALEVLVRGGDDLRVGEVPIVFKDRTFGQSKMGSKVIFTYMRRLLALSGWRESKDSALGALTKSGLVAITDFAAFAALIGGGFLAGHAQLCSFWIATLLNFLFKLRQLAPGEHPGFRFTSRFIVISALASFLRDAVFAILLLSLKAHPLVAVIPAIGVSAMTGYLGYALFVWPKREQYGTGIRWRVASLCIIGYTVLFRLVSIADVGAAHRSFPWAESVMRSPGGDWIAATATSILGLNMFSARIGAFLCWVGSALFLYGFARACYGKSTAFKSTMLFGVLPYFFWIGVFAAPDGLLTLCWAGALYFLSKIMRAGLAAGWIGVGICITIGTVADIRILAMAMAAVVLLVVDAKLRRTLVTPWPYLGAALTFVSVWLISSYGLLSHAPGRHENLWLIWTFLLSPVALLFPTGAIGVILGLIPQHVSRTLDSDRFCRQLTLFPWLFLLCASPFFSDAWRMSGPIWLSILPVVASGIGSGAKTEWRPPAVLDRFWPPTIAFLLIAYGCVAHYLTFARVTSDSPIPIVTGVSNDR